MQIIKNDIDIIAVRDYVVGMGWALLSLIGAFISFAFEKLPIAVMIKHAPGFGIGQLAVGVICLISLACSFYYLYQTSEYQKYLGK